VTLRRLLISLTVLALIAISAAVGVIVADWPHSRQLIFGPH